MRIYSADIYVNDLDWAIEFYVDRLGFEKRTDVPMDDQGHRWVEVAPEGSETVLILAQGFGVWTPEKVGGWSRLILQVADLDQKARDLKDRGVEFKKEPESLPWGVYGEIRDPDGNEFGLLEPTGG